MHCCTLTHRWSWLRVLNLGMSLDCMRWLMVIVRLVMRLLLVDWLMVNFLLEMNMLGLWLRLGLGLGLRL